MLEILTPRSESSRAWRKEDCDLDWREDATCAPPWGVLRGMEDNKHCQTSQSIQRVGNCLCVCVLSRFLAEVRLGLDLAETLNQAANEEKRVAVAQRFRV